MRKAVLLVIAAICTFSCKKEDTSVPEENIKELVYGRVASVDNQASIERTEKTAAYLSKELGIKVRIVEGTDYASVIEAMKTGKVDFALTGAFSYVIAASKAGAEPLVTTAYTKTGKLNNAGSKIFTSAQSGITSMEQVLANPQNYSIAFADPASTSGYLYPLAYLRSQGIEPTEDMKQTLFSGGHTAGVFSCLSQKVDLACTTQMTLTRLEERNRIKPGSYKILWQTNVIPPSNVYVRASLPKKIKNRLSKAFVEIKDKDTALMNLIKKAYRKDIMYVPIGDSIYEDMRKMVNKELGDFL
ncbi:phosphate/phosphite/phosphonate ABC transporter substrate-binding protein [Flavobacteriaceae bacterium MHTCC 0001]